MILGLLKIGEHQAASGGSGLGWQRFSQWNLCLRPSIKVSSSCLLKYFQTVWWPFSLLLCRNTVEGRAEMCAKCSHTLSKWAIWHYTPLNTPNGRQRKPLFVIFRRQPKSKFMDRKWSKKCIYEPFWSSENGFWPYLLYLRRCICQAQIHSRYQLPSAPILLFSKQTLLHFETKKKPHTFKIKSIKSGLFFSFVFLFSLLDYYYPFCTYFWWDNFCILCLPDSNISSRPSIGSQLFHHLQFSHNIYFVYKMQNT